MLSTRPLVYTSFIELTNDERKAAILHAVGFRIPEPLPNIRSILSFGWNKKGKIAVIAGSFNFPDALSKRSKADHKNRLATCRSLVSDLIVDLKAQKFNVSVDYLSCLERYAERLPKSRVKGNIGQADAQARILRSMFAAEFNSLTRGFPAQLRGLLEEHAGLRVYYQELTQLYVDIQTGVQNEQAPTEAFDKFIGVIHSNRKVFDVSVGVEINATAETLPAIVPATPDSKPIEPDQILPPPDPLGQIDETKARNYTVAGVMNALWKTFKSGKKISENTGAWQKVANDGSPYMRKIIEWLSSEGGGPPSLPPTISI